MIGPRTPMYEAEVKSQLVNRRFRPSDGWEVHVHLDPMELCRGGSHPRGKRLASRRALARLRAMRAFVGVDHSFRVDVRASHPKKGLFLVEAKGGGSQQKESAFYSALGQLLTKIGDRPEKFTPALAFPDEPAWERQVAKLPRWLLRKTGMVIFLVSRTAVREWAVSSWTGAVRKARQSEVFGTAVRRPVRVPRIPSLPEA